jgi:hypothetical protein
MFSALQFLGRLCQFTSRAQLLKRVLFHSSTPMWTDSLPRAGGDPVAVLVPLPSTQVLSFHFGFELEFSVLPIRSVFSSEINVLFGPERSAAW